MNNKQLLLIGGAAVALIVIIAAALIILPGLGGAGNHVILASINNDGDVDINMLPFGDDFRDGVELAEDAQLFGCEFTIVDDDNLTPVPFGIAFIPEAMMLSSAMRIMAKSTCSAWVPATNNLLNYWKRMDT